LNPSEQRIAEGILFTDQYQLTMAQLYYRTGLHEKKAQFDHFYRNYPNYGEHKAGYCINAGLAWLLNWIRGTRFREEDLDRMRGLTGQTGEPVFQEDFLGWLRKHGHFEGLTIRAIPEGRVVHPNVPLTVVEGPIAMAQVLESSLLNHLNYQILIATKACRIREAGHRNMMMEFGMRRGHGFGVNAGARAALIGGADYTSNAGISHVLNIPPKGTHAHSMVQAFMGLGGTELDAFRAYAEVYPDDCLLPVATVDTLGSGIPNAIKIFEELKKKGHEPVGIRLDSGDLAYLSIQAARMLNDAGFPDTSIVLSNQLDELTLWQITGQILEEAGKYGLDPDHLIGRLVYGVGTRLITSKGDAALDGVYKLVSMRDGGEWKPAIKVSESLSKTPNPGEKSVWRIYGREGKAIADLLGLPDEDPREMEEIFLHHPIEHTAFRTLKAHDIKEIEPLLEDVYREGAIVCNPLPIEDLRKRRDQDLERLHAGVKRIMNPHRYHVSLTRNLWDLKQKLIEEMKGDVGGKEEKKEAKK